MRTRYSKKRRTTRPRRKQARRRTRNVRATKSLTCKTGFPKRMFVANDYVLLGSTAVTTGNNVIPCQSSAFQCLTGVSNSQALYFDQYKAIYNRFRIHGMKVSITAFMTDAPTNRGLYFGMFWNNTASVPGTMEGALQQPGAKYKLITTDNTQKWLSSYRKCYQVIGTSKSMYNTDLTYQALVTTNPSTMAYCNIWFYNPAAATLTTQYIVKVKLYCEYFEPTLIVNT